MAARQIITPVSSRYKFLPILNHLNNLTTCEYWRELNGERKVLQGAQIDDGNASNFQCSYLQGLCELPTSIPGHHLWTRPCHRQSYDNRCIAVTYSSYGKKKRIKSHLSDNQGRDEKCQSPFNVPSSLLTRLCSPKFLAGHAGHG